MPNTTTIATFPHGKVVKTTHMSNAPVTEEEAHPQKAFVKKKTIFRFYQVIWYVLTVVEVLLAFRILLKALGANPLSGFTSFVYALTDPLALPFQGILVSTGNGVQLLEWSTILAGVVYFLVAYGIVALLQFVKPVSQEEVEESVDEV